MTGADQRKTEIIFSSGAERRACYSGDAGFFEEPSGYFFGGGAGVFDIDPGVERAVGYLTTKAGNAIEAGDEEVAALAIFHDHGVDGVGGIAEGFDGGDLSEFGDAGESVEDQQIHGVDDVFGSDGIAEAPAGHGKTF